jgi:UDP-N-acetylmuramate-alanine ligase
VGWRPAGGEGDVVLTLGAGDITEVGSELLRIIGGAAA